MICLKKDQLRLVSRLHSSDAPAREANREVANLTERKNPHTPICCVKEFVCLLQSLTPIISGLAKQNGLKKFRTSMAKTLVSKNLFARKVADMARDDTTTF